ncbi:Imm8 family immunity protein [Paenibacillus sp. P32E]|uniref:Imm8 family immunity protein n=1 Tax=Paenibacillus sp. P32E TaxID=1349434 RepID=UPI00093F55C2|nr:Imm8 family immunity protein [Paenibacillus sp. P32E]OKP88737.1 hypothetical protein A3848_17385 [Paenibacillus sp. P32E]
MIRPILKETHFHEVPEENKDFCTSVVLDIGVEQKSGSDHFYATVATANGLKDYFADEAVIVIRGLLLVNSFDFD